MGDNTGLINAGASGDGPCAEMGAEENGRCTPGGIMQICIQLAYNVRVTSWPSSYLSHYDGVAGGAGPFYMTPKPKLYALQQHALRILFVICTAVASPAARSTVLWHQCVTVSIHLQAEYSRPRPHHRANVLGQLGKCGVTQQLRRNSMGAWECDPLSDAGRRCAKYVRVSLADQGPKSIYVP